MVSSGSILAYLDASTGSMIAAALAGGVAGLGVILRTYGNRLLAIVSPARRARIAESKMLDRANEG